MPITEEQRQTRRQFIGGSDIAGITGHSHFSNPVSIWKSKVQELENKDSKAMSLGNMLEPVVLKLAEEKIEKPIFTNQPTIVKGVCGVNLDGYAYAGWLYRAKPQEAPCIIEAKTAGFSGQPVELWDGRAGTDEVPVRAAIQCQYQLQIARSLPEFKDLEICHVAVLTGHDARGFRIYRIKYQKALCERLEAIATHFWNKWVATNTEPPEYIDWQKELP